MAIHGANPLMKWVVGLAAIGGIGYLLIPSSNGPNLATAESGGENGPSAVVKHPNFGIGGESDATDEVLGKLLGESALLKEELAKERLESKTRLDNLQSQVKEIENNNNGPSAPSLPGAQDSILLKNLQSEIDNLRTMVSGSSNNGDRGNDYDLGVGNNEFPVGLNSGIPNLNNPNSQQGGQVTAPIMDGSGSWIDPMDMSITKDERGNDLISLPDLSPSSLFNNPIRRTQNSINRQLGTPGQGSKDESTLIPVYTIPADGTLVKAITRTALLGRIPIGGTVTDAYKFKLLVGSENLASNGHRIPGLHGMTLSGVARGDYTLKCVLGDITSITYTFTDGTIRTVQSKSGGEGEDGRLGYIADEQGVPCITGKFISNAPEYLSQSISADIFAAAAGAFANQEKVFTTSSEGATTSQVTGDPWINMGGEGVKAGANTASDWVKQRQQSAFDAIYAAPGTMVEVHLEKEIHIDYDTNGRKTAHHEVSNYGNNRGLD